MPSRSPAPANGLDLACLFERMRDGEQAAVGAVIEAVYTELRRLAARQLRGESSNHTLQPTALVNEAYLRLLRGQGAVQDRAHFFALASQAMRRVFIDHARAKQSLKRGGAFERVTVDLLPGAPPCDVDVLALEEALSTLAAVDPRAVRVVELKFFAGHTDAEIGDMLGQSVSTVRRDWEFARAWLKTRLRSLS